MPSRSRSKEIVDVLSAKEKDLKAAEDNPEYSPVNLGIVISKLAYEGLTAAAKRYRTSRSHIADLVFVNLHKLRLIDIVEDMASDEQEDNNETDNDQND